MKVTILMSAYNGEQFIAEQLESLFNQKDVEVAVVVRDDGSTDNTATILREYQFQGKLTYYSGPNKGWAMSFLDLLLNAPASDYYAFCDHDDIWMPEKLSEALKCLETLPVGPRLYASNLYYFRDGKNEGLHRLTDYRLHPGFGLVRCIAYGCTCVFNSELANIIRNNPPRHIYAHDYWLFQTALLLGHVYYDERSFILYRQHQSQQIGAKHTPLEIFKRRLNHLKTLSTDARIHEDYAKEILYCYSSHLSPENKELVECVAYYRSNLSYRLRLMFSSTYSMGRLSNNIIKAIRVLISKY